MSTDAVADRLARALAALYARVPLGMRLGLDPMRAACVRAGHPEAAFAIVHIAGTNGKGSTAAMVASIVQASGVRTGLYTSPHLVRFAERIRIDGEPIDDGTLATVLEEALGLGPDLSFFETATLAALLAFRRLGVAVAVLEVGIGGRLDATNVIGAARCSALTRVAFDHQDKLGDTLTAIAREKAAIARPGVPFVIGAMDEEPYRAAVALATERGARIVPAEAPSGLGLGLFGPHQDRNAAVAWTIADELGIDEAVRRRGLASVTWPGRCERIDGAAPGERWILDGAHNPDGAEALVLALAAEPVSGVVFGALADKAWPEMLAFLLALDAPFVFVAPKGRAAVSPEELVARARTLLPGRPERTFVAASNLDEALSSARSVRRSAGPLVVCGSLYLVGEARATLLGLALDPIVAL